MGRRLGYIARYTMLGPYTVGWTWGSRLDLPIGENEWGVVVLLVGIRRILALPANTGRRWRSKATACFQRLLEGLVGCTGALDQLLGGGSLDAEDSTVGASGWALV